MRPEHIRTPWFDHGHRPFAIAALFIALSPLIPGSVIGAQQQDRIPLTTTILGADGVMQPLPARPRGFSLFAQEDLAGTSLRLTGFYRYAFINAGGLCPFANTAGDIFNTQCGTGNFFHITPWWGIGPVDYAKILAAYPGVSAMKQPVGYSTPWRVTSVSPITLRINAADGQFGQYYAGVTSTTGAGCLDFSGASGAGLPANFTLTASSDCPQTWAGTGFDGMYELPDSVWLQRFLSDKVNFRWDDWRIPKSAYGIKPLGNDASYGAFSDYPREVIALYGGVTPLGIAGAPPTERGFPLGIYVRADAWKFDRPSLRDGVFVRWLVINNSAKVWGQPVDYDKLYMGIDPGYILNGQAPAGNNIPALGLHWAGGGGMVSGRCTASFPKRVTPGANEPCKGSSSMNIIMVLKSPIGDLRNKLFSDPTSPFQDTLGVNPKHDDTITFNHWVKGRFGQQEQFSWRRDDRSMFGAMSGNEDLWLDGRSYSDFTAVQIWEFFAYEFTDGSQSLANLRYNKTVIGNVPGYGKWDYDDDGIQDTLFLPDCGSQGCVGLWGDSVAGGFSNARVGNIGNYLGVGPFSMKSGDTTEFIFYLGGVNAQDTTRENRQIAAVTTAFFKNYAGAAAVPPPTFTAADVQLNSSWFRDSTAGSQTAEVRIQVKMPPRVNDPFLQTVLTTLKNPDSTTPAGALAKKLRDYNPNLINTITGRMKQNLATVLVFKSCDLGVSWTNDAGCTSATAAFRTRDQNGNDIGLGWRPAFTLTADSVTGQLSTNIVSDIVNSGRTYLYSFVTKSRSLADIRVNTSVTPAGSGFTVTTDNLQNVLGVDIDTIMSGLVASGPTTVLAYAPISVPAGTVYARLDTARAQQLNVTNRVSTAQRTATADGVFRMRFGNRFILTRTVDTLTNAQTTTVIRQSTYARAAPDPLGVVTSAFVAAADTFVSNHGISYSSASASNCAGCQLKVAPLSTVGNVQTFLDTLAFAGYVVGKGSGGTDPVYLAVSNNATAFGAVANNTGITQNTSDFEGAPWYPGFTATVTGETASPGTRSIGSFANVVIRAPGDTLNTSVIGSTGVVYVSFTSSGLRSSPGGVFQLKWQGDAWGPGVPFRLATVGVMQPIVDASMAARPTAAFTDTATTYRTQLLALTGPGEGAGGVGTRPLVRARVPFTIVGEDSQPTKLVMLQRHQTGNVADSVFRNSRLVGSFGDTARVAVPADAWMPGDTLWVFESKVVDSTVVITGNPVSIVRDTLVNGKHQFLPIQVTREILAIKLAMQCAANGMTPSRVTCNPLALGTTGATGYRPYATGWTQQLHFNRPFDQNAEVTLTATPIKSNALPLSNADMSQIHVVPNPFVVQSAYDQIASTRVAQNYVKFVNVPAQGSLRIYSVSGQLLQQLTWQPTDLVASGNNSPHGDLAYNLRTKEGLDLSSGLYLYVLTPSGAMANNKKAVGKFVVIR